MTYFSKKYPIDPEVGIALDAILDVYPGGFNAPKAVLDRRKLISGYLRGFPQLEGLSREDLTIQSSFDGSLIPLRIYRPHKGLISNGIVFSIHGGGMVTGSIEDDDGNASRLSLELGTTVIAVEYRLAPEFPFPAAFEDCYQVATWILNNSAMLGVDKSKSLIYGGSAGGGLAIATTLALRDRISENFSAVVAPYPMVDFRNNLPSTERIIDLGVWDRAANEESWQWYLGGIKKNEPVSPYASPLHAENFSKLPPFFLDVGDCDLFLDEVFQLAQRLIAAGTPTEFHCYPGAFHACELFAPEAALSRAIWRNRFDFMKGVLA